MGFLFRRLRDSYFIAHLWYYPTFGAKQDRLLSLAYRPSQIFQPGRTFRCLQLIAEGLQAIWTVRIRHFAGT